MTRRTTRVAGIVLAAGASTRMGAQNKLLASLGDRPVVVHTVNALLSAGLDPVLIVSGHEADQLERALAAAEALADPDSPVRPQLIYNPRHQEGMGTSLAVGVAALPDDCDGFLVALGDMPGVRSDTIERLIAELATAGPGAICVPTFAGVRGNPVLFSDTHRERVGASTGDSGARRFLVAHPQYVCEVSVSDAAVLRDVDTKPDLETARTWLK